MSCVGSLRVGPDGFRVRPDGRAGRPGRWKSRHFVLIEGGRLSYFRPGQTTGDPCGTLFLPRGAGAVRAGRPDGGRAIIEIRIPEPAHGGRAPVVRTYVLGASSRTIRDEWLAALIAESG